jgi:hypothetical protein
MPEFHALLLRAGVTDKLEAKLAAYAYAVYDPAETGKEIMDVAQRLGYNQCALNEKEVAPLRRSELARDAAVEAVLKQADGIKAVA